MTDQKKKEYGKPELNQLGDDSGELSEKDLNNVSGGYVETAPPCLDGSQAHDCGLGSDGNVHEPL